MYLNIFLLAFVETFQANPTHHLAAHMFALISEPK